MRLRTEETEGALTIHRGAIEQTQHATHLLIEFLGGILEFPNQSLIGQGHIVIVVGIRHAHRQTIRP